MCVCLLSTVNKLVLNSRRERKKGWGILHGLLTMFLALKRGCGVSSQSQIGS